LNKRSQFAVEYLLVVGIGLIILIPSIILFYNYSTTQSEETISVRINNIGRNIVNNAETIYFMGPPSRRTLEEEFPNKIFNISISNTTNEDKNYYGLKFVVGDAKGEHLFLSEIPITGPYYNNRTQLCDNLNPSPCYSGGKKKIILQAGNNNVSIIIR
jgi:uncharacterized protein (UPF0333 family)